MKTDLFVLHNLRYPHRPAIASPEKKVRLDPDKMGLAFCLLTFASWKSLAEPLVECLGC